MSRPPRTADPEAAADPDGVKEQGAARREAAEVLRIASATAGYAAERIGHRAASPSAAAWAIEEAATELARAAVVLHRLARGVPVNRAELVVMLAADGVSRADIAVTLGLPARSVAGYLREAAAGR